jgi:hypothetical protein
MNHKREYPAYDSEAACLVLLAAMVFCFWFGAVGYTVAQSDPLPGRHVWVPVFIMVASAFVIVSTTVRLVQRYYKQRKRASIRP